MKILKCTNDDLGTYAIEVQNQADGNPKSLARLVNAVQAKFTKPIISTAAVLDSEFKLECCVEPESVEVEWYRNSTKLSGDDSNKISADGSKRALIINKFQANQAGTYFVKIKESSTLVANEPLRISNVSVAQPVETNKFGLNNTACKEGGAAEISCLLESPASNVIWYRAIQRGNNFEVTILENDGHTLISHKDNLEHKLDIKNVSDNDEAIYVIQVKTETNKSYCYSCNLNVTDKKPKPTSIIKSNKPQFISTVNQVITAPGSVAEFCVEVEPHNCEVVWYNGNRTLKQGDKYQIMSQGHKRILRVNNCNEDLDNGQFIVQIKAQNAFQRVQIAHLRVGAPTPKDLLAKWAEEMQRCQNIMSEMASCQKIFEQKAIDAEEKLKKWRKQNPLKGDGKSSGYNERNGKSRGADDDSDYSSEENTEKKRMTESDIKRTAAAALKRSGGSDRESRLGRSVSGSRCQSGRESSAGPRCSIKDRASMFSNGSSNNGHSRRKSMPFKKPTINDSVMKKAAEMLPPLDLPDDMPPAERKMKELEYQLKLKDLINAGLQEELDRVQGSLNKAVGQVSAWQYDRRGMDFQPATSNDL